MHKMFLGLTLSLISLSTHAQLEMEDDKGLSSRWYKVLPESQSLISRGTAQEKELRPESIKALVWNIKKASLLNWQKEFLEFGKDKDLMLLQEAYETPKFETTLDLFPNSQWDMGISFVYRQYGNAATGTMVGSTALPVEVIVKHSYDREPVIATPKALTFAKYNLAGKDEDLLVISVHAINFETTGAFKRQMDQIEEQISRHQGPVFLAGDFNTWNASRSSYLNRLAERHQMSEPKYINDTSRMTFNGWPLDHILVRGAEIKTAEVVGTSSGSDHKPFLVEMSIP